MNVITWLHLSDLHFSESQSYDANIVIKSLLEDIKKRIMDDLIKPNFIIVSGDIANAGLPNEYEIAKKFFDELLDVTQVPKERLFLIAGNHDVNRNVNPTIISGLKTVLVNRNSVNGFLLNGEERNSVFKRFGNYQKFFHEYFGKDGAQLDDKNYFYARKFKVADRCIAVLGLNSAWMSTCQEEKGQLLIGESQIRDALYKSDDADLRLAVMHHPLEWLRSFDSNDAESLLHEGCDFILQGHMHRTGISLNTTPDTETLVISAGACYETREYPNSYNFVRLDLDTSNFTLYLRMYSDERGGFWTKDVKSYRNVADGIYTRPFWKSLSESLRILKKESIDKPAAAAHQPEASETKIYYGNSYLLKENFAGRVHERKLLSDWLIRDEHQILALTAIGGMGKSALAWAWLHRDVLNQNLLGMLPDTEEDAIDCKVSDNKSPESVFWWSFYEQESSFGRFLDWLASEITKEIAIPDTFSCTYDKIKEVVNVLRDHRFLLVLDGFERELRAYSTLNAAYKEESTVDDAVEDFNRCTDLNADIFLRSLAAFPLKSKLLLTSRIIPFELTEAGGCKHEELKGLNPADAVRFFQSIKIEGKKIEGTEVDIENACKPYEYHPLALRILAGLIIYDPEYPMDMKAAEGLDPIPKLKQREHHIFDLAYRQLSAENRSLLSRMAAYRSPMKYDVVRVVSPFKDDDQLREALMELEKRNLIQFDRSRARYDLHQLIREYAYRNLENKIEIHMKLKNYLSSVSESKKVRRLEDLTDSIELYHHTVNSGLYDEAINIFYHRLSNPISHIGAFQICIKLLRALFPDGEDLPPKLNGKDDKGYVLNELALCYGQTGQPRHAELVLEIALPFAETGHNRAVAHGNLSTLQLEMGKLMESEKNIRAKIKLHKDDNDVLGETLGHLFLSRLFAYSGDFVNASKEIEICDKLNREFIKKFKKDFSSGFFRYRTKIYLLSKNASVAERSARKALKLENLTDNYIDNLIEVNLDLSKAILANLPNGSDRRTKLLEEVEIHLHKATVSCRSIALVEQEPDILLTWAKFQYANGNIEQARIHADEALYIANRCEYKLKQADTHNFIAYIAKKENDSLTAKEHATLALEIARCDGSALSYKPAMDTAIEILRNL